MESKLYHITESVLANHQLLAIKHLKTGNTVSVFPDYGGAINDFIVDGRSVLPHAENASGFENITKKSFAGAQMFPFVNRTNNAKYTIAEKDYFLPLNDGYGLPHALHGMVYNQPFKIADLNEEKGEIKLQHHFKKTMVYPFDFFLEVAYTLDAGCLQVTSLISNTGKTPAPFGYGWHPYISVSGKIDYCRLQLPARKYFQTDEMLIPNGKTNELSGFSTLSLVGNLELNHCFEMPEGQSEYSTIMEDQAGRRIELIQKGFGYTQYYIPPDRKSIAIEPQTSIPDALNNGVGLLHLQPDQFMNFSFRIVVSKNN